MDVVIGWGLVVGAVAVLCISWRNVTKAIRSKSWRTAPGEVVVSRVTEFSSGGDTTYAFEFRYRYLAHDGSHDGSRLRFTPVLQTQSAADELVEKYPVGRKIDVLYDPAKTNDAVVEPGGGISLILLPLCALIFGTAGAKMLGLIGDIG